MRTIFLLVFLWLLLAISSASAQTALAITSAYAKEITVDGTADPGSGHIVILDTSYEVETRIGTGDISGGGTFAIMVTPPIIEGHSFVAIDDHGHRSPIFTTKPARSGFVPAQQ